MAELLPIRAFNRTSKIRIGSQKILHDTTTYIDLEDLTQRKDYARYSSLGAVFPVGGITQSNSPLRAWSGLTVSALGVDMDVTLASGEMRSDTGVFTPIGEQVVTIPDADLTLDRIDIVAVSITGIALVISGDPSSNPTPPVIDSESMGVAEVYVMAAVTTIDDTNLTDTRIRF